MIVWFVGLPCSGKTTLAREVARCLNGNLGQLEVGRVCEVLDGDELRASPFADEAGFDSGARRRHLRRVGYLAQRLARYTPYVLCSFVAPSSAVRAELPVDLLVYVKCSPAECARRDVKGMWAKARRGEIRGFTGYDAPFEAPSDPGLTVDTSAQTIGECVAAILVAMQ